MSLGEPGEYKFDKRYEAQKPYVYINLYNNHWRTNFSTWIGNGQRMSAKVRIWTFDKFTVESSIYTPAMEMRVPMKVAASKVKNGKLPVMQHGISLSRKGVAVSAFGPNPDGDGYILRLWENAGKSGVCTITLPEGLTAKTVQPVDLRGRPRGEPIAIKRGSSKADLNAYAPATFQFYIDKTFYP